MHYNINSILADGRLEELQYTCDLLNIAVLVINESKLNDTIPNNIISLKGYYDPLRRDRLVNGRHGGGCLIYIADSLTFNHRTDLQSEYFEHLWADINVGNLTFTVTTYYRPPNESSEDHNLFLETSESILTRLTSHQTDNKIIVADFNFGNCYCKEPILSIQKPLDKSAPDLFASYGFSQIIDIPTRMTQETTSLIDLIFVQKEELLCEYGTLPKIADHEGTVVCFDIKREKRKTYTKLVYDYKSVDVDKLLKYIKEFDFNTSIFTKNVCSQAEVFSQVLLDAFEKFIPSKTITIKPNAPAWSNTYTRLLLRKKNRNYSIFKKASTNLINAQNNQSESQDVLISLLNKKNKTYKNARIAANESLKANRRVKNEFYNTVNSTMNNQSKTAKKKFSILIKLMNNQKFSIIPPLIENGSNITDAQLKSNILNKHFTNKSTVNGPNDEVPHLPKVPITSPFNTINTSPIEVSKIIRQLKKSSSSHCGIPAKFLAIIATPISFPLSKLFNNFFEAGYYPDIWKISHVTAIFKNKGLKTDKNNYRPISLLPTLSKVCEAVIHNRLSSHCIENNIITIKQAAYMKGDSTLNQLLYLCHKIRQSWTNKNITHGVFLDVTAAFDKVWHKGLLYKLDRIAVEGKVHQLFTSYLAERKQVCVVDGIKSNVLEVKAGVPQGSRLGPLLFIIYINDITENLESDIQIFADDCSLLVSGKNQSDTSEILNRDLNKISTWASNWKIIFNAEKSKTIIFSKNKHNYTHPVQLQNNTIDHVTVHKHLGVYLTHNLDWTEQIKYICLSANRKLSVLRRVRYLQRSTLDLLYKITVRSVLDYGLVIFYNSLNQISKKRLDQLQYNAAKLVSGALHLTSRVKLETELGWESISKRAEFLGLTLFHKINRLETRPLIRSCMPDRNPRKLNDDTNISYRQFPFKSMQFANSFFSILYKKME